MFTQQSHRLMLQQRGCCNDFLFSAEAFPFENGCLGHCLQCVHHHRKRISLCKAMDYFNAARSTHLPDHTDARKRNHNETLQCPRTRSQSCNFMQVHVADIRRQTDLLPHYITWALRSTIDKQSLTGPTFSTRGQHHADKSSGLSETAVTRAQLRSGRGQVRASSNSLQAHPSFVLLAPVPQHLLHHFCRPAAPLELSRPVPFHREMPRQCA